MSEFRNGLRGTLACACYTLRLRLVHVQSCTSAELQISFDNDMKQELSYRKQIVRQLHKH